eukprot:763928-Hanusia_phi.AAC.1
MQDKISRAEEVFLHKVQAQLQEQEEEARMKGALAAAQKLLEEGKLEEVAGLLQSLREVKRVPSAVCSQLEEVEGEVKRRQEEKLRAEERVRALTAAEKKLEEAVECVSAGEELETTLNKLAEAAGYVGEEGDGERGGRARSLLAKIEKMKEEALRAQQGDLHLKFAEVSVEDGDWKGAEKSLKEAAEKLDGRFREAREGRMSRISAAIASLQRQAEEEERRQQLGRKGENHLQEAMEGWDEAEAEAVRKSFHAAQCAFEKACEVERVEFVKKEKERFEEDVRRRKRVKEEEEKRVQRMQMEEERERRQQEERLERKQRAENARSRARELLEAGKLDEAEKMLERARAEGGEEEEETTKVLEEVRAVRKKVEQFSKEGEEAFEQALVCLDVDDFDGARRFVEEAGNLFSSASLQAGQDKCLLMIEQIEMCENAFFRRKMEEDKKRKEEEEEEERRRRREEQLRAELMERRSAAMTEVSSKRRQLQRLMHAKDWDEGRRCLEEWKTLVASLDQISHSDDELRVMKEDLKVMEEELNDRWRASLEENINEHYRRSQIALDGNNFVEARRMISEAIRRCNEVENENVLQQLFRMRKLIDEVEDEMVEEQKENGGGGDDDDVGKVEDEGNVSGLKERPAVEEEEEKEVENLTRQVSAEKVNEQQIVEESKAEELHDHHAKQDDEMKGNLADHELYPSSHPTPRFDDDDAVGREVRGEQRDVEVEAGGLAQQTVNGENVLQDSLASQQTEWIKIGLIEEKHIPQDNVGDWKQPDPVVEEMIEER